MVLDIQEGCTILLTLSKNDEQKIYYVLHALKFRFSKISEKPTWLGNGATYEKNTRITCITRTDSIP